MGAELRRRSKRVLVIGTGPESALVASLLGATKCRLEMLTGTAPRVIWLDELSGAVSQIAPLRPERVVVESPLSEAHRAMLAGADGSRPSIVSTTMELEAHLGRVSVDSDDVESEQPQSGISDIVWRVLECGIAILAMIPVTLLMVLISAGLLACGVPRIFRQQVFVGRDERRFTMLVFAPRLTMPVGLKRRWLAASLGRQGRRLHLAHAPGLLSVLRGEVGLVGPALMTEPEYQALIKILPSARLRSLVCPGLVSLDRVRLGRSNAAYDQRRALEYSLYYIKYRSLTLNLRVVARAMIILSTDFFRTVWGASRTTVNLLLTKPLQMGAIRGSRASRLVAPAMPTDHDGVVELLPTLVVGAGAAGTQLVRDLQSNPELGLWPIAVVDDDLDKLGTRISGVPVLGAVESIPAVVERERIERVIVAIPSAGEVARQRVTELAQKSGKQVLTMPSLHDLVQGAASTDLVSVAPSDLLGRPVVEIDPARAKSFLGGKRVLVTGAAGSIGREVVIQALRGAPAVIYGMDLNESDLYDLQQDLKRRHLETEFVPVVASVTDSALVDHLFEKLRPNVVFHAAAYKHVPLMEEFPHEAVRTNIVGTWNVANAAAKVGAERFVMVSTDKAVRPSSVMGATKRLAELVVRDISATTELSACAVRFGNVLGSRGSVIPLFERQIEAGGPVSITDKRMTRYFMTIPEAAGLIIEAGAFGDRGVVYMLDMGEPVKIVDVARRLIRLKGLRPDVDIAIEYSGLRPGEKLFEELSLDFESARPTPHSKIRVLDDGESGRKISAQSMIQSLLIRVENGDARSIRDAVLLKVRAIDGLDLTLIPDHDQGSPSIMTPSISRSAS